MVPKPAVPGDRANGGDDGPARRAAGALLAGMLAFTGGFAAAGLLVAAGEGGGPPYLIAITVGLVGLGLVGAMAGRRTPLPDSVREVPPVWSPRTLRPAASAAGLPAVPVVALLYLLAAVGVLGNLAVPLLGH